MLAGIGSAIALVMAAFRKRRGASGEPRGQTDLEFLVEKILNRSDPKDTRADADELDRMTRLRTCLRGWSDEHIYAQLTKPKARDDE